MNESHYNLPGSQVHFDYFSVDFDEEHSAFYGGVLNDQVRVQNCYSYIVSYERIVFCVIQFFLFHACFSQVEFVSEAISKILSMYKGKQNTPTR